MVYIYPAVFVKEADGGYSVLFKGLPGCGTQGDTLPEAMEMANDALGCWLDASIKHGDPIPPPQDIESIPLDQGQFASLIYVDLEEYRKANDIRSVKRTVTLPAWLNSRAVKSGINFSQALQETLYSKLGLQQP
ncbi:HicB family protein [Clostridia bacterium]|nr:HicB family protein [Clostridia bacterium]